MKPHASHIWLIGVLRDIETYSELNNLTELRLAIQKSIQVLEEAQTQPSSRYLEKLLP